MPAKKKAAKSTKSTKVADDGEAPKKAGPKKSATKRRTAKALELQPLNPNHVDHTLAAADVEWIARIVWASQ